MLPDRGEVNALSGVCLRPEGLNEKSHTLGTALYEAVKIASTRIVKLCLLYRADSRPV